MTILSTNQLGHQGGDETEVRCREPQISSVEFLTMNDITYAEAHYRLNTLADSKLFDLNNGGSNPRTRAYILSTLSMINAT